MAGRVFLDTCGVLGELTQECAEFGKRVPSFSAILLFYLLTSKIVEKISPKEILCQISDP